MFARIRQLSCQNFTGQDIADRLISDILPIYEAAPGFIAYSIVATFTNGVLTLRIFEDADTLEAANEASADAAQQMGADLDIDADNDNLEGDVLLDYRL